MADTRSGARMGFGMGTEAAHISLPIGLYKSRNRVSRLHIPERGGESLNDGCECHVTYGDASSRNEGIATLRLIPPRSVRAHAYGALPTHHGGELGRRVCGGDSLQDGHLSTWWDGEEFDAESGLPHLAHALCCRVFIFEICRDEAAATPIDITEAA